MISQRSSSVLRGIFALLLATMQPPLRVSQILAELSEGAPLQTWTWIGSPASLDQKKTRYPPIRKRLGNFSSSVCGVAIQQMGVIAQKSLKTSLLLVGKTPLPHGPIVRRQLATSGVETLCRRSFKMHDDLFDIAICDQVRMNDLGTIFECHIRVHHVNHLAIINSV